MSFPVSALESIHRIPQNHTPTCILTHHPTGPTLLPLPRPPFLVPPPPPLLQTGEYTGMAKTFCLSGYIRQKAESNMAFEKLCEDLHQAPWAM